MTITGKTKGISNGGAYLIGRTSKTSNRSDWSNTLRNDVNCKRVLVSFNTKDELELKIITEDKDVTIETYRVAEIAECYAGDFKDFKNVLVIEVSKNQIREDIVLQFDNEQEFRRTLFTYKYFKMRNRLTHSSSSESSSEGSPSPSPSTKSRSSADYSEGSLSNYNKVFEYSSYLNNHQYVKKFDVSSDNYMFKSLDYLPSQKVKLSMLDQKENVELSDTGSGKSFKSNKPEYDLMHVTDNNGVTHMSVESKLGEIDGLIYTDVEYDSVEFANGNSSSSELHKEPQKPQRRRQLLKRIKGKAPPPPGSEVEVVKGQVVRVGVEQRPDKHQPKEVTSFPPRTVPPQLTKGPLGSNGYESDREEWRSRSTFSSSAFHSLARPARRALAAYYRLSSTPTPPQPNPPMTLRKPSPRNPRNLQSMEYPKNYQSMHPEYIIVSPLHPGENKRSSLAPQMHQDFKKVDIPFQNQEYKYGKLLFNKDYKKNPLGGSMTYLNISNRLYGLTDKLKELKEFSVTHNNKLNTLSKSDKDRKEKGLLKPVIKKNPTIEGSKRPVVRTCSNEPPKKVTFSAFATVQVV